MELSRLVLSAAAFALVACGGSDDAVHAFPVPGDRGARLQVEVLNASGKAGLARTGTRVLRQAGIDVVFFGNGSPLPGAAGAGGAAGVILDSTRIVVRRGDADAGTRVRAALGTGKIVVDRDSSRLLDVSVYLGADFAPRLDFHP